MEPLGQGHAGEIAGRACHEGLLLAVHLLHSARHGASAQPEEEGVVALEHAQIVGCGGVGRREEVDARGLALAAEREAEVAVEQEHAAEHLAHLQRRDADDAPHAERERLDLCGIGHVRGVGPQFEVDERCFGQGPSLSGLHEASVLGVGVAQGEDVERRGSQVGVEGVVVEIVAHEGVSLSLVQRAGREGIDAEEVAVALHEDGLGVGALRVEGVGEMDESASAAHHGELVDAIAREVGMCVGEDAALERRLAEGADGGHHGVEVVARLIEILGHVEVVAEVGLVARDGAEAVFRVARVEVFAGISAHDVVGVTAFSLGLACGKRAHEMEVVPVFVHGGGCGGKGDGLERRARAYHQGHEIEVAIESAVFAVVAKEA